MFHGKSYHNIRASVDYKHHVISWGIKHYPRNYVEIYNSTAIIVHNYTNIGIHARQHLH